MPNSNTLNTTNNSAVPVTPVETIVGAIPMRSLVQNISGRALTLAGSDGSSLTLPPNFLGNIEEIYLVDFNSTELRVLSNVQPAPRRFPERNYRIEYGDRLTLCNADHEQTIALQLGNNYTLTVPTGLTPGTTIKLLNLTDYTVTLQFDALVNLIGTTGFSNPAKRTFTLMRYKKVELTWTDIDRLMIT